MRGKRHITRRQAESAEYRALVNATLGTRMTVGIAGAALAGTLAVTLATGPVPAMPEHVLAAGTAPAGRFPVPAPGRVIRTPFRMGNAHLCHAYQVGAYGVFTNGRDAFVARCRPIDGGRYAWEALPG